MRVAGQQQEEETGVQVDEGRESVTVEPEEREEGDEEAAPRGPKAELSDAERETRRERRRNKMAEAQQARERAETEAREMRERIERIDRENAELRGYVVAESQRRQAGDPNAELNARVSRIRAEAQTHLERSANARRTGDHATAERELNSYHEKIEEAAMERVAARMTPEMERRIEEMRGTLPSPQESIIRETMSREFPLVVSNKHAVAVAESFRQDLIARGRDGMAVETIREAMSQAAKLLRLGGREAPSPQTRQRYQAVGTGEGGGGEEGAVTIPWGPAEKKLAEKSFPHLEPAAAKAAWLKEMAAAKRRGDW